MTSKVSKSIVHDLRLCWKKLLLADIFYKVIAFAALTPIVAILFQLFLSISGRDVLADEDILFFFIRPLGWICLIAVGGVATAIVALEQAATSWRMKISSSSSFGRWVGFV